jgi:ABC-type transporter Mla maintaining outer membrane lipid asymmetry ATPase subunit MlaF
VGRHAGGLTRIVTTVDLGHYLDFADRFILLHDGSLTDLGDRANLLDSTDPRVRELLDGYLAATARAAPPLAETLRG